MVLATEDFLRNGALNFEADPTISRISDIRGGLNGVRARTEDPPLIKPTPFKWRDPATLPRRRFIYRHHYARKYISATLAPGSAGKSSLKVVEALAIVTGRALLGFTPTEKCNVWLWNGEDPLDELERKILAAMQHYRIRPEEVEGRLFFDSGREQKIIIAKQTKDGSATICYPVQKHIVQVLQERRIGVLSVDPFLRSHRVKENDNAAIDEAANAWCEVANDANAAIVLCHHTRKTNGDEVTVEDGRGAVALINASRDVRTINKMTKAEAEEAGIETRNRRFYFRVTQGDKTNLAPPVEESDWYHLASVPLANGDDVGAVEKWAWPSLFADIASDDIHKVQKRIAQGEWRENERANEWAGKAVAEVLDYDLSSPSARKQIKKMLEVWIDFNAVDAAGPVSL